MMSALTFIGVTLLLLLEGKVIVKLLLPRGTKPLIVALALPVAAFVNVLLLFFYTIAGIAFTPLAIIGGHVVITVGTFLLWLKWPQLRMKKDVAAKVTFTMWDKVFIGASGLLLAMNVVYSFSHAVMLPTMQYDSATNWTMRSKISYVDQTMAFDLNEDRGMAKPQYPFLFHTLQITANQGQREWNDTAANAILYFLSIATFLSLFILLRSIAGSAQSAITITAIIGIPLFGVHLAQGYGDLNLAQYFLLSLVFLGLWSAEKSTTRYLLLSGIFIAASVWTKAEGSVFGVAPWLVTVALIAWKQKMNWKTLIAPITITVALCIPWPIFAWVKGLSLTPHSSDTSLTFQSAAVMEAVRGLFSRGSFGITWYAIPALLVIIGVGAQKKDALIRRASLPLLVWGGLMFAEILFIYLCTPNVKFLLNAESYYRQMMIPAAMLLLAISLCIQKRRVATSA